MSVKWGSLGFGKGLMAFCWDHLDKWETNCETCQAATKYNKECFVITTVTSQQIWVGSQHIEPARNGLPDALVREKKLVRYIDHLETCKRCDEGFYGMCDVRDKLRRDAGR